MSSRQIPFETIICDGCSLENPRPARFVEQVREQAAVGGWTHRRGAVDRRRTVDMCPNCRRRDNTKERM